MEQDKVIVSIGGVDTEFFSQAFVDAKVAEALATVPSDATELHVNNGQKFVVVEDDKA